LTADCRVSEKSAGQNRKVDMKSSKADQVADVLRREITLGIYPAGSDLPSEARLSARFAVSRPSSREALRVLESEGLIRVARGARGGAKVLLPTLATISRYLGVYLQMRGVKLAELYSALQSYEPQAARAIATRRDQAALSALAQCVARQEFSTHDRAAFNTHEEEFRRLLLAHCGNEVIHLMGALLTDVYGRTTESLRSEIISTDTDVQDYSTSVGVKRRLIKLMADGDADKAELTWRTYLAVYWRRVSRRVGADKLISVYSSETPAALVEPEPVAIKPARRKRAGSAGA
jgi:DNA-binding FadR family transcriptional regulator